MVKKILLFFLISFLFLFQVKAQIPVGAPQVCAVILWVRIILGLIVIAMVVFSGYQLMTGQGDPKSIETAKMRIIFALVGGAVIALANNIVQTLIGISC
ncbi:MAG: hypothetical protein ACPLZH_00130 [Minisyncoccales bacterium]